MKYNLKDFLVVIYLLLFYMFIGTNSYAQKTLYPEGAYMGINELNSRKPSFKLEFTIKHRTPGGIKMSGGADYIISCNNSSIDEFVIKRKIFAVSIDDTLYLNCYRLYQQKWYAKVISEGKYLVFYGPLSKGDMDRLSSKSSYDGNNNDINTGTRKVKRRKLYIVDTTYGVARPLNRIIILNDLEPYPSLKQQFLHEQNMNDDETMLKYIQIVNQGLKNKKD